MNMKLQQFKDSLCYTRIESTALITHFDDQDNLWRRVNPFLKSFFETYLYASSPTSTGPQSWEKIHHCSE